MSELRDFFERAKLLDADERPSIGEYIEFGWFDLGHDNECKPDDTRRAGSS